MSRLLEQAASSWIFRDARAGANGLNRAKQYYARPCGKDFLTSWWNKLAPAKLVVENDVNHFINRGRHPNLH